MVFQLLDAIAHCLRTMVRDKNRREGDCYTLECPFSTGSVSPDVPGPMFSLLASWQTQGQSLPC
jgi:hypothetical protein